MLLIIFAGDKMIGALITSQTRIRLLKKFFLNSNTTAHLRGLESEFNESSNAIRVELNRFEDAGLLLSSRSGNKKIYRANLGHPLFDEIHRIVLKEMGIDRIIDKVIHKMGNLESVYLTGDFAKGKDAKIIELILVGTEIDMEYLQRKTDQAEEMVGRKVKCAVLDPAVASLYLSEIQPTDLLPIWSIKESGKKLM